MNISEGLCIALGLIIRIVFFKYPLKLALKGLRICFRIQTHIGVKIIETPIGVERNIVDGSSNVLKEIRKSNVKCEFSGTSFIIPVTRKSVLTWTISIFNALPMGSSFPKILFAVDSVRMMKFGFAVAVFFSPFTKGNENTSKNCCRFLLHPLHRNGYHRIESDISFPNSEKVE